MKMIPCRLRLPCEVSRSKYDVSLLLTLITRQPIFHSDFYSTRQAYEILVLTLVQRLITSLQGIRRDIDANIESFYDTPAKTFLQSNIEQLTAIYQLWYILPKLRPFIPDVASESPRSEEHGNMTYRTSPAAEIQAWRETKKSVSTSGCFDREPRSLSVVPPNKMLDRDVKEIQDGRAMYDGGFGIFHQP